jgi:hypothetical protein
VIIFLFSLLFNGDREPAWVLIFCAAIIAVLVLLLCFIIWVAIFGSQEQREAAYRVYRTFIGLFKPTRPRRKSRSCHRRGRS